MKKFFGSLVMTAIAGLVLPAAKGDAPPQCAMGNAIMNGAYVSQGAGTVIGVGPVTSVGLLIYNGDGTGMAVFSTRSVNGASSTSTNVPASFTVNADCTGSKVIGTTHFNFVITADGSTITWIITDTGFTVSGTAVRLRK